MTRKLEDLTLVELYARRDALTAKVATMKKKWDTVPANELKEVWKLIRQMLVEQHARGGHKDRVENCSTCEQERLTKEWGTPRYDYARKLATAKKRFYENLKEFKASEVPTGGHGLVRHAVNALSYDQLEQEWGWVEFWEKNGATIDDAYDVVAARVLSDLVRFLRITNGSTAGESRLEEAVKYEAQSAFLELYHEEHLQYKQYEFERQLRAKLGMEQH